jgi:hypothetical protein
VSDASLALQKAVVTTLRAAVPGVAVRDRIKPGEDYPILQIAEGQTVDAGAECLDGVEVFLDIHVWSRAVGMVECRSLAGRVRAALHDTRPVLEGAWRTVDLRHRDTRFIADPDGITSHAVVTIRALIDPA